MYSCCVRREEITYTMLKTFHVHRQVMNKRSYTPCIPLKLALYNLNRARTRRCVAFLNVRLLQYISVVAAKSKREFMGVYFYDGS